jgi:uncharacterized protein (DUF427 family)
MVDAPRLVEPTAKRVRAFRDGAVVLDTVAARLVWADRPYPAYYVPRSDLRGEVEVRSFDGVDALDGYVHVPWDAVDAWFEEDEEVIVHPRDPHARVDILRSSRHVQVAIDGVAVADSVRPTLLFETGLPTRYYLPVTDLRVDLLRPSDRVTSCPYKGHASYWSVQVNDRLVRDVVWTYKTPLWESAKIAGLAAFFNERVDLTVDGVVQERPTRR